MSDKEIERLARKFNLRHFLEPSPTSRSDDDLDFVINRKDVIDQLLQRDNRSIAFWSAVVAVVVVGAIISLSANFL